MIYLDNYISVIDHPSDYLAMGMATPALGYSRKGVLSAFHTQLSLQSLLWGLQIYLS